MKTLVAAAMVLAVGLVVAPVMAADQDSTAFHALGHVTVQANESLPQMSDEQLSAVEGQYVDICAVCLNIATVGQANINGQAQLGAIAVQIQQSSQGNAALVGQSIN